MNQSKVRRGEVIRVSDHWASTNLHPRSRKLNCGSIDGHQWRLDNVEPAVGLCGFGAGKYPWRVLAGVARIADLERAGCGHWATDTQQKEGA